MTTSTARETEGTYVPGWTFGDKFRKARRIAGLDQRDFATHLGLTASTVAAYEGDRAAPRLRDVTAIAKSLQLLTGIEYSWFLDFEPPTTPTAPSRKITNRLFATDHTADILPFKKKDVA